MTDKTVIIHFSLSISGVLRLINTFVLVVFA